MSKLHPALIREEVKLALSKTNINYSGELINEIARKIYSDAYMTTKFGAKVIRAVKGKYVYHDLTESISMEAYAVCPASGTGTATLNQRSKDLCTFQMTAQFDHNSLLDTYLQSEYGIGYRGTDFIMTEVETMIFELFNEKSVMQWNDVILNGDTTSGTPYLALCDGLLKLWLADATVHDVTAVAGNLVPTTAIFGELDKLFTAAPKELLMPNQNVTVKIGISNKIAMAYEGALFATGNGYNVFNPTVKGPLQYKGVELVPLYHLPDNQMFMTTADNIHLVYDDETDFTQWRVVDLRDSGLCDRIVAKMVARAHVDYVWGDYVVWYH